MNMDQFLRHDFREDINQYTMWSERHAPRREPLHFAQCTRGPRQCNVAAHHKPNGSGRMR